MNEHFENVKMIHEDQRSVIAQFFAAIQQINNALTVRFRGVDNAFAVIKARLEQERRNPPIRSDEATSNVVEIEECINAIGQGQAIPPDPVTREDFLREIARLHHRLEVGKPTVDMKAVQKLVKAEVRRAVDTVIIPRQPHLAHPASNAPQSTFRPVKPEKGPEVKVEVRTFLEEE